MGDLEEKEKLIAEFQRQLEDVEADIAKNEPKKPLKGFRGGPFKQGQPGQPPVLGPDGQPLPPPPPPPPPPPEEIEVKLNLTDTFTVYEEMKLEDGRILRRYDTGAVRVENPKSGVIQEERLDGSLVVSLPTGTVIFQDFRGEPLMVYNIDRRRRPGLARVSSATLPGETASKFVFFFQDEEGVHLIELGTLRYYKIRPPAKQQQGGK